jgi:hypothetical protein
MDEKELQKILSRLAALEQYVADRKKQQLTTPLDNQSRQIINGSLVVQTGAFINSASANVGRIPVTINGVNYTLMTA